MPEVGGQRSEDGGRKAEVGSRTPEAGGSKSDGADEGAGEEAELTAAPMSSEGAAGASDDEGYVWPEGTQEAEAVEARADETPATAKADAPLPTVADLVKQIPADARDALEELFRARFVSVKRVSPKSLKPKPGA